MLKVAVVILNWNGAGYLEKFLPGVVKTTRIDGVEVFVADNNSSDASLQLLEDKFPEVKIIKLDKNYGFAEGYNRAINEIEAEYILLLNSDVQVTVNWLKPLVETLDSDPLIAACAPKVKGYHQRDFFEHAGAAGGYIDKYGYAFCRGRIFDSVETDYGQYDQRKEIFWTTGACMLIRGPLYKLAGGLDQSFFAHFEEIDLCWRLKNRGYKFISVPDSTVFHVGGGTLSRSDPRKTYLNFRNNLITLYKNLPREKLFPVIVSRLLLDSLSMFRFLKQAKFRDIAAILKAHFSFYGSIGRCRMFRKEEKKFISNYAHKEIYPGSIVRDFFLKKKYTFVSLRWLYHPNPKR